MLMVISPAKTLDFERPPARVKPTQPDFLDRSAVLVETLRTRPASDLGTLMNISPALAELNAERFRTWQTPFTPNNARPAIHAFRGDVYQGLDADSLSSADVRYAQQHLRILSGLYGLLRPLDLIQPYRLEMGTRLAVGGHRNLHAFWGETVTDTLNAVLAGARRPVLVNLASEEYFGAVQTERLNARIVTPTFREFRNGRYQFISMLGKRARGLMARFAITTRVKHPEGLKAFAADGYRFDPAQSGPDDWVFTRGADASPAGETAAATAAATTGSSP